MKSDQTERIKNEALRNRQRLNQEVDERRTELLRPLRQAVAKQIDDEFFIRVLEAEKELRRASAAHDQAMLEDAAERAPIPLGTKVHKWARPGGFRAKRPPEIMESGIVEVFTADSPYPARSSYRPDIGTVGVRILKKDGTPGVSFEVPSQHRWHEWIVEGKDQARR